MRKPELIAILAEAHPHLPAKDIERTLNAIFGEISLALGRGDRVELRGFGAFRVRQRMSRTARNPRTGEAVKVGQKQVPFFKAGNILRQRVDKDFRPRQRKRHVSGCNAE